MCFASSRVVPTVSCRVSLSVCRIVMTVLCPMLSCYVMFCLAASCGVLLCHATLRQVITVDWLLAKHIFWRRFILCDHPLSIWLVPMISSCSLEFCHVA